MKDEGGDFLMAVIGIIVVGGVMMYFAWPYVLALVALIFAWNGVEKWKMRRQADAEARAEREALAPAHVEVVAQPAEETPAGGSRNEYADSYRRHRDLGYANVDLWVYPALGVIRRTVKVREEALIKKHGQRIKLDEMSIADISPEDLMVETVAEVATLLNAPAVEEKETARQRRRKSRANRQTDSPQKVTEPAPEKELAVVTEPARKPRKRPQAVYEGKIVRFGVEEKDGEQGKYQTYSLHLLDPAVDAPHSLNGVDLERAIKEAQAQPGDRVKVEKLGKTQVDLPNGKTGFKNLWAVTKFA